MKGFFTKLLSPSRRPRRSSRPAVPEDEPRRSSDGAVEIRIDPRRFSPTADSMRWAEPVSDVGQAGFGLASQDGRVAIVGSGNFGVQACSKEDFMQIQTSVMDAFARAEAQFGEDEGFAEEIEEEIDVLFDEFEQLKNLLMRAQRGDCDTDIERDVIRLKTRIHDIVGRINDREREYALRKGRKSPSSSEGDEAGAGRGIESLTVS